MKFTTRVIREGDKIFHDLDAKYANESPSIFVMLGIIATYVLPLAVFRAARKAIA